MKLWSFEASKLRGFCNRNRNFNIRLRKFNSECNLPFLALDLLLPLSCVWGSAQFENILSHVHSTLWYGRWENSVQFFSNEFSKTSIYKHYFTSQLDILSKKGFYLFCVKKTFNNELYSNFKLFQQKICSVWESFLKTSLKKV